MRRILANILERLSWCIGNLATYFDEDEATRVCELLYIEQVRKERMEEESCPTCGAAPSTFVDGDCPECNPPMCLSETCTMRSIAHLEGDCLEPEPKGY